MIMNLKLKRVDLENASLYGIFSTADEDRHGDIVEQNWDLKNFKKNPVILNSHNYGDATEVIGKATEIGVNKKETIKTLEGSIQFAVKENPKAKIIFDLYAGGFLSAFSVGFLPKEFDDKGKILKSELLEISAVSVPANAMALAKAKGIDVDNLYDKQAEGDNEGEVKPDESQGAGDGEAQPDGSQEERKESDQDGGEEQGTGNTEEEEVEDQEAEEEKPEDNKVVNDAKSVIDIRQNALARIVKAITLVSKEVKVDQSQARDKAKEKALVNKAIKELLKIKSN